MLQGWSARGAGGRQLMRHFRHGAFAAQMIDPGRNAISLGPIDEADAGRWNALDLLLVPYSSFVAVDLRAGETVLVSGATGNFGSAGVAVALAMGAAQVVAPGRNEKVLGDLARPVRGPGPDRAADRRPRAGPAAHALRRQPVRSTWCWTCCRPRRAPAPVRAAALTVREFGRVVLMGGVDADLALPLRWLMRNSITVRGQWMFPRAAAPRLVSLVRAGLLDLNQYQVTEFSLDDVNQAVEHAAGDKPFMLTVVRP